MAKVIYTAEAHVTGGRAEGHGASSDGALEVDLRSPVELGGAAGGTNPEQLFAIGYASCFESALGVVARRQKLEVADVAIDSKVMLLAGEDRKFELAVALDVTLPSVERPRCRRRARTGCARGLSLLQRRARQHRGHAPCQRPRGRDQDPVGVQSKVLRRNSR